MEAGGTGGGLPLPLPPPPLPLSLLLPLPLPRLLPRLLPPSLPLVLLVSCRMLLVLKVCGLVKLICFPFRTTRSSRTSRPSSTATMWAYCGEGLQALLLLVRLLVALSQQVSSKRCVATRCPRTAPAPQVR